MDFWKPKMSGVEQTSTWDGGSYMRLRSGRKIFKLSLDGSYMRLRSGRKIFKLSLDDSDDRCAERSPKNDGRIDADYNKDNDADEKNTEESVSKEGSEHPKEENSVDLSDFKEDILEDDSHHKLCADQDLKTENEARKVSDELEQQNCSANQDNNDCKIVQQAKLTVECDESGKTSLEIVFDNNVFQKLETEMAQLPPEKALLKYVITVENVTLKGFEDNLFRTLEYCNTLPLEFRLQLGREYKIKVVIQKYSSLDTNFTTFTTLEVRHRKVLQKWELKKLMKKAEHFVLHEANGEKLQVMCAYRNKPYLYFVNIKNNRSNIMEVYIKDNNGDPGCPINGQIKGLFFGVRPEPSTMQVPTESPFGERQMILPIDQLVKSNIRLYFADFWCHYKKHSVTLVATKPNTDPDTFCKEHLLELSLESNPFFFCKSQDGTQNSKFYCCKEPRVEILYTENVDLNEDYITWKTVKTFGKRGSSTPGGKPKRSQCPTCNL